MYNRNKLSKSRFLLRLFTTGCAVAFAFLSCQTPVSAEVDPLIETKEDRILYNRSLEIESNNIEGWPQGPVVNAKSAILMDAGTGVILYGKDVHSQEYPASTTKILTSLIAIENSSMDEIVTFSNEAVFGTPRDSNHIAMNVGDTLTMEECLNAILIRSANEVSNAVAEHVGGSIENFADMMNARAAELGCVDSHFVNANGLPDDNHYTSAYDLATIGRAFFANETLCKISLKPLLVVQKPSGEYLDANQTKLLPGKQYEYPYLVGCKTGYTDIARNTLVACAEKDGLKLICVVMRDENPEYYEDVITLFDYGFSNFEKINVSETETKYHINDNGIFYSDIDIFGSSKPILSLNSYDYIILPKTAGFDDVESTISYDTGNSEQVALISYTFHGNFIGNVSVDFARNNGGTYTFDPVLPDAGTTPEEPETEEEPDFLFINVFKILLYVLAGIFAVVFLLVLFHFISTYRFSPRDNRFAWRLEQLKRNIPFKSSARGERKRRASMAQQRRAERNNRRRRNKRDGLHF